MDFTFGIVTDGRSDININLIIDSIEIQNIKNYEIVIVGNSVVDRKNTKILQFDESIKTAWITKKKNLITENALYENIVYLHDYVYFSKNWYDEFVKFGNEFDVCMNVIINTDGKRFRDWCLWHDDVKEILINREYLLPYDVSDLTDKMYISGTYFVSKKKFMSENILDESLSWGESEDVEWSYRIRKFYKYRMNYNSIVKLLKNKYMDFNYCDYELVKKIKF